MIRAEGGEKSDGGCMTGVYRKGRRNTSTEAMSIPTLPRVLFNTWGIPVGCLNLPRTILLLGVLYLLASSQINS
jgi:hypothetical protein